MAPALHEANAPYLPAVLPCRAPILPNVLSASSTLSPRQRAVGGRDRRPSAATLSTPSSWSMNERMPFDLVGHHGARCKPHASSKLAREVERRCASRNLRVFIIRHSAPMCRERNRGFGGPMESASQVRPRKA